MRECCFFLERGLWGWSGLFLVADVFGGADVDDVFADVFGVVADAFEDAANEDEVEVSAEIGDVLGHALGEAVGEVAVELVELAVAFVHGAGGVGGRFGVVAEGIGEHFGGEAEHGGEPSGFGEGRVVIEAEGAASDGDDLVADAFEVVADFHRGDDLAHVGGEGLEAGEDVDAEAVVLDFEGIDFFVIGDSHAAGGVIAFEEAALGVLE